MLKRKGFLKGLFLLMCVLLMSIGVRAETEQNYTREYPKSVALNKTSIFLYPGRTYTLKATTTPEKVKYSTVYWKSSNKKVCAVDRNGVIKAGAYGEAVITVKTVNRKTAQCTVHVGSQYPTKVKLNVTSRTLRPQQTLQLKAATYPEYTKNKPTVSFKSSNKKVAVVNRYGLVKAVGYGTCNITARAIGGKTAVCKLTVMGDYSVDELAGTVTVNSQSGSTRTYRLYNQFEYEPSDYFGYYGCVTTAVSIAASGFGVNYTAPQIHYARASYKYGELYAVNKLGYSTAFYDNAALSLKTAAQILKDMGISAQPSHSFTPAYAVKRIQNHLKKGKPVIIKVSEDTHNGLRLGWGHHALVLAGLDSAGKAIILDPGTGKVNVGYVDDDKLQLTVEELVRYYMFPCVGNWNIPYVSSLSLAGGYILVG